VRPEFFGKYLVAQTLRLEYFGIAMRQTQAETRGFR